VTGKIDMTKQFHTVSKVNDIYA